MTYEYLCTACGHEWEATQSINDQPLKVCPSCGKHAAQRQISGGTGFVLKGSGWYADGYGSKPPASKSDAKKDTTKKESGSSGSSDSSKSTESSSKPADKAKSGSGGGDSKSTS